MRRLRPMLPQQAPGGGQRPHLLHRRRLPPARQPACRCRDYQNRHEKGQRLRPAHARKASKSGLAAAVLRLRAGGEGRDLYWWHPLVSGDPETVHAAGVSVRARSARQRGQVPATRNTKTTSFPGRCGLPAAARAGGDIGGGEEGGLAGAVRPWRLPPYAGCGLHSRARGRYCECRQVMALPCPSPRYFPGPRHRHRATREIAPERRSDPPEPEKTGAHGPAGAARPRQAFPRRWRRPPPPRSSSASCWRCSCGAGADHRRAGPSDHRRSPRRHRQPVLGGHGLPPARDRDDAAVRQALGHLWPANDSADLRSPSSSSARSPVRWRRPCGD